MQTEKKHIIRRQVLDIYTGSRTGTWELQNNMRDYYYAKILPLIASVLDQWDISDQIIRLEHLEIDLGTIEPGDLNERTLVTLQQKITEALQKSLVEIIQGSGIKTKNAQKIAVEKSEIETVLAFLETGTLPWNSHISSMGNFEELVLKQITASPVFKTRFIEKIKSAVILRRLVNQFSVSALYRILIAGFTHSKMKKDLTSFADEAMLLTSHFKAEFKGSVPADKKVIQHLFEILVSDLKPVSDKVDFYRKWVNAMVQLSGKPHQDLVVASLKAFFVSQKDAWQNSNSLVSFFEQEAKQLFQPFFSEKADFEKKLTAAFFIKHGTVEEVVYALKKSANNPGTKKSKKNLPEEKTAKPGKLNDDLNIPEEKASKPDKLNLPDQEKNAHETTSVPEIVNKKDLTVQHAEDAEAPDLGMNQENNFSDETFSAQNMDGLFISNAGLVILWSYIPHFFKRLGLITDNGFKDEESKHRAVHLLQYVATGLTDSPEFETTLAKILCGLEVTDVLENGFAISPEEKDEAESLLQAVIKNWGVLGNAGNQALRQSFISRSGMLIQKNDSWLLHVERSGIDILVDKLPWSISLVRLGWMNKSIFVEWN